MNLIGELLGTFILVLLGNGVVASCILSKTKAEKLLKRSLRAKMPKYGIFEYAGF